MNLRMFECFVVLLGFGLAIASCGGDGGSPAADETAKVSPTGGPTTVTPGGVAGAVELTWWGQSMFVLNSPGGVGILMDPYGDIGYRVPEPGELDAGIVTVSHEHPDHNNVELSGGSPVLRGLTGDGWAEIDETTDDVRILTVPTWHDTSEGSERGRNAIFIFETGGLRIAHVGDLGHWLLLDQIDAVGPVDVLLLPVGGFFTIGADLADEVIEQLAPRVTIPMHYKTDAVTIPELEPADEFLEDKRMVEPQWSTVELRAGDLPPHGSGVIWVMEPVGAQP